MSYNIITRMVNNLYNTSGYDPTVLHLLHSKNYCDYCEHQLDIQTDRCYIYGSNILISCGDCHKMNSINLIDDDTSCEGFQLISE